MKRTDKFTFFFSFIYYLLAVSFYFYDPVLQTYPSVITNQMMAEFGVGTLLIGFLASSYYWSYNLIQIPCGFISDKFGPALVLVLAYVCCALGLLLFYFSTHFYLFLIARFIMGIGGGCSTTLLVLISAQCFSKKYLGFLVGVGQLMASLGAITGQMGFAWICEYISWRGSVLMLALLGFSMAGLCSLFISKGFSFSIKQKNADWQPRLFLKTVFKPHILSLVLYAFFLWGAYSLFANLWGVPYLSQKLSLSTLAVSRLMTATWLGSGLGSMLLGLLAAKGINKAGLLILSALIGVIISALLIGIAHPTRIFLLILLFSFGLASAGQALSFAVMLDHIPKEVHGAMTALLNSAVMLGPMIFEPLLGGILQIEHSYDIAFLFLPVLFLLALVFAYYVTRPIKRGEYAN